MAYRGAIGGAQPHRRKPVPDRSADFAAEPLLQRAHRVHHRLVTRYGQHGRDGNSTVGDRGLAAPPRPHPAAAPPPPPPPPARAPMRPPGPPPHPPGGPPRPGGAAP